MSKFWQNWLKLWASGVILFGVVLASGSFAASDGLIRPLFDLFGNPLPESLDAHHRFAIGLTGAVSIGWGVTLLLFITHLVTLPAETAAPFWRGMLYATVIWYIVDGVISVATRFAWNVASNTMLLVLLLVALVKSGALRREN